jgi:hypothetical protein
MKLPFTLGIKFVFRIILPGFILALGFLPILRTIVDLTDRLIPLEYAFAIAILLLGWILVIFDMPIYMVFEGRRYWPQILRTFFNGLEKKRLQWLEATIKKYKEVDHRKYIEASVEIRRFPLDDTGRWEARFPTRLGNLLTSYEEYSKRIYGMWQAFYWPRIWLTLDKDLREEIDSQQALADSALYSVFALYTCGFFSLVYAFLYLVGIPIAVYLPRPPYHWVLPLVSFASGYFIYRQSLHVHAQFGETFKAVFDLHGHKVMFPEIMEAIASLSNSALKTAPVEKQNQAVWFYLNNYRVKCAGCGKTILGSELRNHKCSENSPTTEPLSLVSPTAAYILTAILNPDSGSKE